MNDDTPFLGAELASAYLDNEATPDDRAQVEAAADLRAQVADFDRLRSTIGAVTPLSHGARESALAAAMAAFDQLGDAVQPGVAAAATPASAAPPTSATAPVISLAARRQRMYRIVTGVAAAGVLTVGGIAVLQRSGSDDKMSATTTADAKIASAPADAATAMAPAETMAPADTVAAADVATADTAAPAESTAPQALPSSEADTAAGTAALAPPQLANEQDLAAYAAGAPTGQQAPVSSSERIIAPPPCAAAVGDGVVIGEVVYAGEPALAVRLPNGHVTAVAISTCTVIAEVIAP